MCVCVCVAAVVPGVKGFDEDSIASHSTTHDDMQDSHVTNGITNISHPFHGGGYMLAASYWPKVSTQTLQRAVFMGYLYNSTIRIGTSWSVTYFLISLYRTVL